MKIITSPAIPQENYFTVSAIAPVLEHDQLTIMTGEGARHGWGRCRVTSTVICDTSDFIAVYLAWQHKRYGSLFGGHAWRYYERLEYRWQQKVYKCLTRDHKDHLAALWRAGSMPHGVYAPSIKLV